MPRINIITAAAAIAAGALFPTGPAAAQAAPAQQATTQQAPADSSGRGEKVNQLIVYGNDPCPQSDSPDEITVCARKDESERFRIPEPLRGIDNPANRAWTDRVLAYETVGKTGTMSCTPVGPGGYSGCAQKLINQAYAERGIGADVQFSQLIADERAKRLSTIDEEARETQARVEAAERQYEAQKGSLGSPDAADATKQAPPPATGNK